MTRSFLSRSQSQAERMESELDYLRKLKQDAFEQQDPNRVIVLTRVLLQQEAAISKQRIHEGKTLDVKVIEQRRDELAQTVIKVAKRWITDKETYDSFVDDLLQEMGDLWQTPLIN